jgi:nitrogen fixation protein NifU and related proteins
MTHEMYKENVMDHYKNPRNKGILKDCSVKHKEVNPLCGDEITIYLLIDDNGGANEKNEGTIIEKQIIKDVKFEGHGCAISQASISLLTDYIKEMTIKEVTNLSKDDILSLLGIQITHNRMKCALLSLKTVQVGLNEFKQ